MPPREIWLFRWSPRTQLFVTTRGSRGTYGRSGDCPDRPQSPRRNPPGAGGRADRPDRERLRAPVGGPPGSRSTRVGPGSCGWSPPPVRLPEVASAYAGALEVLRGVAASGRERDVIPFASFDAPRSAVLMWEALQVHR